SPVHPVNEVSEAQDLVARELASRLVARGKADQQGFLVLNPCSYSRRLALELEDLSGGTVVAGPVKACQVDGSISRLVVEVPALGFAWFPRGSAETPPSRMRLADSRCVRNEYLEAEIDPATGGLRSLRDTRTRIPRIGQQLVFNPGSSMRVKEIRTQSA